MVKTAPDGHDARKGLIDVYNKLGDKANAAREQAYLKNLDADFRPMK